MTNLVSLLITQAAIGIFAAEQVFLLELEQSESDLATKWCKEELTS